MTAVGLSGLSLIKWLFMKVISVFLLLLIPIASTTGQDMKWPEDRAMAEEKVALYSDELEFENYREAADHLYWLLVNAPDLHVSLYQNGSKIYENLAIEESEPELREIYLDSLMLIYDMRMTYYDDRINVMNRKAYKAYKYFIRNKAKYEWLLELFDNTILIAGGETMSNNIPAYMNVIKVNRLTNDNLTLEEVFKRYNQINRILDHKAAKGEDIQRTKDFVDKLLTEAIPEGIDCEFVKQNLGPKFKENPSDIALAKRIFGFMLNGKCTDDPLFLEVAIEIQRDEPTYGIAYKVIAKKCLVAKNLVCAEKYFRESLSLASEDNEKIEVYNDLARLKSNQDKKLEARDFYRQALMIDSGNKDAFEGLGNLYYYSASDCAEMQNLVEDRLPYLAAYQMYEKAGNDKMMQASQEQFPSKEEIFTANLENGQVMTVKCWISETVVLKTRD